MQRVFIIIKSLPCAVNIAYWITWAIEWLTQKWAWRVTTPYNQSSARRSGVSHGSLSLAVGRGFRRHKHLLFCRAAPFANEATRRPYTCRHVTLLPRKQRRAKRVTQHGSRVGEFVAGEGEFPLRTACYRSVNGDRVRAGAESMAMDAASTVKVNGNMTFAMQIGLVREAVTVTVEGGAQDMTMATLKDIACAFVDRKVGRWCPQDECWLLWIRSGQRGRFPSISHSFSNMGQCDNDFEWMMDFMKLLSPYTHCSAACGKTTFLVGGLIDGWFDWCGIFISPSWRTLDQWCIDR